MRNPLQKRIPRDLRKNFIKYFGMVLILVCTICVGSSFQVVLNGAVEYLGDIVDNNLQEDGFFETMEEINSDTKDCFTDKNITVVNNFYATENEYNGDSKVLIFDERTEIDTPVLFEGAMPSAKNEIALDHVFARSNEIKIGDTIHLIGEDFKVVGTASFPDYSSLFMNNSDLVMNTTHFGVSVVDHDTFSSFEKKNMTYRYSYRFTDRNLTKSEIADKNDEIKKYLIESGCMIQSLLPRDQNQSITFLELDIGTDGPFMTVFVYILVAMIAFIFAILTNNTIESESVIIGTLLASGYRKREIIMHYLQPTLIIALAGSIIGNAIGYTLMIEPFMDVYYSTYSIGPLTISFDYATFALTTVLPVLIMIGINYIMLAKKLSLTPLKFLRRDLKKGKQKKAVRLPDFSFLNRFRIRVILQNKGSYLMLFTGIFLVSFLLMFGIGLGPLMNHYTEQIDKSLPYEYQYILKAPVDTDAGEKLYVTELDAWFELGKKDVGVMCYGIESDSKFFAGAYEKDGVSISSSLSKKLGIEPGDTLVLKDDSNDKEYTFNITGVYTYDAAMVLFMDKTALTEMLDVDSSLYNCIISNEKLDIDEMYVAKQIARSDMLGAASQMIDSFSTIILFVNIFSVVVYIIIMYIMTKVVIDKNALSISYMKVFGYRASEIRKLYLTATTIVVVTSLIVCIPIEIALFKAVLVFLSSMIEGYMEFYLPISVYVKIVLCGLVSYLLINGVHMLSIKKIPMTEALKNRE